MYNQLKEPEHPPMEKVVLVPVQKVRKLTFFDFMILCIFRLAVTCFFVSFSLLLAGLIQMCVQFYTRPGPDHKQVLVIVREGGKSFGRVLDQSILAQKLLKQ